jgi:hypothetical protein
MISYRYQSKTVIFHGVLVPKQLPFKVNDDFALSDSTDPLYFNELHRYVSVKSVNHEEASITLSDHILPHDISNEERVACSRRRWTQTPLSTNKCKVELQLYGDFFDSQIHSRSGSVTTTRILHIQKHVLMQELFAKFPELLRSTVVKNPELLQMCKESRHPTVFQQVIRGLEKCSRFR